MCENFGLSHGQAGKPQLIRRITVANCVTIATGPDDLRLNAARSMAADGVQVVPTPAPDVVDGAESSITVEPKDGPTGITTCDPTEEAVPENYESYAGLDLHAHPLVQTARKTRVWHCDVCDVEKPQRPR